MNTEKAVKFLLLHNVKKMEKIISSEGRQLFADSLRVSKVPGKKLKLIWQSTNGDEELVVASSKFLFWSQSRADGLSVKDLPMTSVNNKIAAQELLLKIFNISEPVKREKASVFDVRWGYELLEVTLSLIVIFCIGVSNLNTFLLLCLMVLLDIIPSVKQYSLICLLPIAYFSPVVAVVLSVILIFGNLLLPFVEHRLMRAVYLFFIAAVSFYKMPMVEFDFSASGGLIALCLLIVVMNRVLYGIHYSMVSFYLPVLAVVLFLLSKVGSENQYWVLLYLLSLYLLSRTIKFFQKIQFKMSLKGGNVH